MVAEKIETMRGMLNDLMEDHREEGESIEDAYKRKGGELIKALDDISEDHREEGEEIENLRKELDKVKKERDEANRLFMQSGKKDGGERTYSGLRGDLR